MMLLLVIFVGKSGKFLSWYWHGTSNNLQSEFSTFCGCVFCLQPKQMHLDVSRPWPPVVACSFTEQLTCVTFQGSSSTSVPAAQSGEEPPPARPKGVVIYANSNIPMQVCTFERVLACVDV